MTTFRQAESNRKNAEKSTGPKTPEGKAVSSRNAVKHGLTSESVTADERPEYEAHLDAWRETALGTATAGNLDHEQLFEQMILQTVRLQRAQRREFDLIEAARQRAQLSWESDRMREAEAIGETISRKPGLAVATLRTFSQGVQWLIERWEHLEQSVKAAGKAAPEQLAKMQDLLGTPLNERGDTTAGLPLDRALPVIQGAMKTLIEKEWPQLEQLNEYDRARAERGFRPETSREERLNRRYEDVAYRRWQDLRKTLTALVGTSKPVAPPQPATPAPVANSVQSANSAKPAISEPQSERTAAAVKPAAPVPSLARPAAQNEPSATTGKMGTTLTTPLHQRSA